MKSLKPWRLISVAAVLAALHGCASAPDPLDPSTAAVIDEPGVPKQLQARQIIVALPDRLRAQWPTIARELQAQYRLRPVGEFPLASIKVHCLVFQVPTDQPLETVCRTTHEANCGPIPESNWPKPIRPLKACKPPRAILIASWLMG